MQCKVAAQHTLLQFRKLRPHIGKAVFVEKNDTGLQSVFILTKHHYTAQLQTRRDFI